MSLVIRLRQMGEMMPEVSSFEEAADEIERLTKMVRHASECGVTFPPDTLPRIPGAVIVSCPACKADWKFNDHDNCPTCALASKA